MSKSEGVAKLAEFEAKMNKARAEYEALVASGQHGAASRKAEKIQRWATSTAVQYTEAMRAANGYYI